MRKWITALVLAITACVHAQQLIVRMRPNVSPEALAAAHHVVLLDRTQGAPFALFAIPGGVEGDAIQAEFQADPDVVWAEDNDNVSTPEGQGATHGSSIPAVGGRSKLYEANLTVLKQINWSSSLANSKGRTVRIAILDTGLSTAQNYLWAKVDANANFIEPGLVADDGTQSLRLRSRGMGVVGHGTMVAGIVDMIAPQTRLVIARVADSYGDATAWTLIEGLAFAVTSGAEVANISLGSPNRIVALTDVMDWCEENNLLVVAAIGNAGLRQAFYPAQISKAICVAGLNPDNTKAAFSNYDGSVRSSAPATGIVSQWWNGQMGVWSGTSFSSPMVAASIADCLRRNAFGQLSLVRNAVKTSGRNIDPLNPDYRGELGTLLDFVNLNATISGK
jgi:hypothetical protein